MSGLPLTIDRRSANDPFGVDTSLCHRAWQGIAATVRYLRLKRLYCAPQSKLRPPKNQNGWAIEGLSKASR
jgi:hypothetical protein